MTRELFENVLQTRRVENGGFALYCGRRKGAKRLALRESCDFLKRKSKVISVDGIHLMRFQRETFLKFLQPSVDGASCVRHMSEELSSCFFS